MPQFISGSAYYSLKENTGDWFVGHTIKGPYGEWELTVENHESRSYPFNGWTWYDTAPSEYVTWYSASYVDDGEE